MDHRRRFKADISNSYIHGMFARKKPIRKQAIGAIKENSSLAKLDKTVLSIPQELLPQSRKLTIQRDREIVKPSHWIAPSAKESSLPERASKEVVFQTERESIGKRLESEQSWSRAAKSLSTAINPKTKECDNSDVEVDDEKSLKKAKEERKNRSRQFLQAFFDKANLIAAELDKTKMIDKKQSGRNASRPPKLAWGVEPGADEIIL